MKARAGREPAHKLADERATLAAKDAAYVAGMEQAQRAGASGDDEWDRVFNRTADRVYRKVYRGVYARQLAALTGDEGADQ